MPVKVQIPALRSRLGGVRYSYEDHPGCPGRCAGSDPLSLILSMPKS